MGLLCKNKKIHSPSTSLSWLKSLEVGADIGAVFFDLTKAFDTVPPRALLEKRTSNWPN